MDVSPRPSMNKLPASLELTQSPFFSSNAKKTQSEFTLKFFTRSLTTTALKKKAQPSHHV
jgi:hypothetical protein